jgi:hypothetical protein
MKRITRTVVIALAAAALAGIGAGTATADTNKNNQKSLLVGDVLYVLSPGTKGATNLQTNGQNMKKINTSNNSVIDYFSIDALG